MLIDIKMDDCTDNVSKKSIASLPYIAFIDKIVFCFGFFFFAKVW